MEIDFDLPPVAFANEEKSLHAKVNADCFIQHTRALADHIHVTAVDHGWWEQDRNDGELLALIHSEVSECLESLRHGNGPDSHIPQFSGAEAELADVVIRVLDMSAARGWNVPGAIVAKMRYNEGRAYKHGNKKF